MATETDLELTLYTSDPRLLERAGDDDYDRAAQVLEELADARRLRLLHALAVGEDTPQRAAVWSGLAQSDAECALAAMALAGLVERHEGPRGVTFVPRDGHQVVQLYVALAHAREGIVERHPRLLAFRGDRAGIGRARKVG